MNIDGVQGLAFSPRELVPEERVSVPTYARTVGATDATYSRTETARSRGYAARPLPLAMLTFFNTIDESDVQDVLGIVYGKTLYTGTEFEWGTVATEVEPLVGQTRVADAYECVGRDGTKRQFLVLLTEFHTKEGELVSRQRITFIEKAA